MPLPAIDADLVARLVESQFPQWADRTVTAVEPGGWDNRTFRLGDDLLARLPSADDYSAQVARESEWLPRLAPLLPLKVPTVLAEGRPSADFPRPWSIRPWLPGSPPGPDQATDTKLATQLAGFLNALYDLPPMGGPLPGKANFHRGGPLQILQQQTTKILTEQTTTAISQINRQISGELEKIWRQATAQPPPDRQTWLHGDIAPATCSSTTTRISQPSSTSAAAPSATRHAIWSSPGPTSGATPEQPSSRRSGPIRPHGSGPGVGRYGRRWSPSRSTPTRQRHPASSAGRSHPTT